MAKSEDRYPIKKQSFSQEKEFFFCRVSLFIFGHSSYVTALVVNHIDLFRSNVVQQDLINSFFDLNDDILIPVQNYEC